MTKSQGNLFSILIVVVSLVAGYLYYSSMDTTVELNLQSGIKKSSLEEFKNLNIDFSLLDDERLGELTTFGENPVDPGPDGDRRDIFVPVK